MWENLVRHLIAAKANEELNNTLSDPLYLSRKAFIKGAAAVEGDLLLVEGCRLASSQLLRRSIAQCAHLLNRCDTLKDVQVTLQNRLGHLASVPFREDMLSRLIHPPWLAAFQPPPDLSHPALIRTLAGHEERVRSCTFTRDGNHLISTSDDETVRIWETVTGRQLKMIRGIQSQVQSCCLIQDGSSLVCGNGDGTLLVVDILTGEIVARF